MRHTLSGILPALVILLCACDSPDVSSGTGVNPGWASLTAGQWTVRFNADSHQGMSFAAVLTDSAGASPFTGTDSIHFPEPDIPDSIRFSRKWELGGGSILVLSVTTPSSDGTAHAAQARQILENAEALSPPGLRSVYLSDRSPGLMDSQRTPLSVEQSPVMNHFISITFDPENSDTALLIVDSLVVVFPANSTDPIVLDYSGTGETTELVRYPDSQGTHTEVFTNALELNRVYTAEEAGISGHVRLTSAFLTGMGFFPVPVASSITTQNYRVAFDLPEGCTAWTPLTSQSDTLMASGPGGITGGLPVALGSYTPMAINPEHDLLVLTGGEPDSLDLLATGRIAGALAETLDFRSSRFSFIEIQYPDGDAVFSVYGGLFFSRGSLESLADLSGWSRLIRSGEIPDGFPILVHAARGVLIQSLRLDPLISGMLTAWFPLRFYEHVQDDPEGLAEIREAYMKNYLYAMELTGGATEYALIDPMLASSPHLDLITGGKGVIVLEYMNSLGLLQRLPWLLQAFTHSWSSNYWPRIYSTLLYSEKLTDQYQTLLRNLLYLPGVPQITVEWRQDNGTIFMETTEFQPGEPFGLPLDSCLCLIHLGDTSFTRPVVSMNGILQCEIDHPFHPSGEVRAIDLNPRWLVPADLIYRRIR